MQRGEQAASTLGPRRHDPGMGAVIEAADVSWAGREPRSRPLDIECDFRSRGYSAREPFGTDAYLDKLTAVQPTPDPTTQALLSVAEASQIAPIGEEHIAAGRLLGTPLRSSGTSRLQRPFSIGFC